MATVTSTNSAASVKKAINKVKSRRETFPGIPNGVFLITGSVSAIPASYDVAGDIIELCTFPQNTYLLGASVTTDLDYDTGGTASRHDLIAGSDVLVEASAGLTVANGAVNFNGYSVSPGEFACDVGGKLLALRTDTAPTTGNTNSTVFTYKCLVYHGTVSSL
jgi:hypothetical protein